MVGEEETLRARIAELEDEAKGLKGLVEHLKADGKRKLVEACREILLSVPFPVIIIDTDNKILYPHLVSKIFGYDEREVVGSHYRNFVFGSKEEVDKFTAEVTGKAHAEGRVRILHKGGRYSGWYFFKDEFEPEPFSKRTVRKASVCLSPLYELPSEGHITTERLIEYAEGYQDLKGGTKELGAAGRIGRAVSDVSRVGGTRKVAGTPSPIEQGRLNDRVMERIRRGMES